MTPLTRDFVPGIDPTLYTNISGAQLKTLVESAVPNNDRAMVLVGTSAPVISSGLERLTRYVWVDTSEDTYTIKVYQPDHPSGAGWYTSANSVSSITNAMLAGGITKDKFALTEGNSLQALRLNKTKTAWEFYDPLVSASDPNGVPVFGQEYLYYFQSRITGGYTPKVVFSGDSTTEGAGVYDSQNRIDQSFKIAMMRMFKGCTVYNRGHSGYTITDWLASYLASDLALAPDLYVLRWGLNLNLTSTFESDLRAGLTILRAAYTPSQMSVLLMSPNCANDVAGGRTNDYVDSLVEILRVAARDFQCTFIDTVDIWRKAYEITGSGANGMMNVDGGDPVPVHPKDQFNLMITGRIIDTVIPTNLPLHYGNSYIKNPSSDNELLAQTAAPNTFYGAFQIHRATLANNWPLDGVVLTTKQSDGVLKQIVWGYADPFGQMRVRSSYLGGWTPWADASIFNPTAVTSSTGTIASKPLNSAQPQAYPDGISIRPINSSDGWPITGQVITFHQRDGTAFQICNSSSVFWMRVAVNGTSWGTWRSGATQIGGSALTSVSAGSALGTGGSPGMSVAVSGYDQSGKLTLISGGSGVGTGTMVTVTSTATLAYCHPVLSAGNAASAALLPYVYVSSATSAGFVLSVNTAPTINTTYVFYYNTGNIVGTV